MTVKAFMKDSWKLVEIPEVKKAMEEWYWRSNRTMAFTKKGKKKLADRLEKARQDLCDTIRLHYPEFKEAGFSWTVRYIHNSENVYMVREYPEDAS